MDEGIDGVEREMLEDLREYLEILFFSFFLVCLFACLLVYYSLSRSNMGHYCMYQRGGVFLACAKYFALPPFLSWIWAKSL